MLLVATILSLSSSLWAAESPEAKVLKSEFDRLQKYVSQLVPDGTVDGFLKYKVMNGYEILWELDEVDNSHSVITLYRDQFAVHYYKSAYIIENKYVLRRFIGPHITGWRNDTVDIESGAYLGRQGLEKPIWTKADQAVIDFWNITLIE